MAAEAVSLFRSFYEQGNPNGMWFYCLNSISSYENINKEMLFLSLHMEERERENIHRRNSVRYTFQTGSNLF